MKKTLPIILAASVLAACSAEQQTKPVTSQTTVLPSQPEIKKEEPVAAPEPVEVVSKEQKQEVENIIWELPDWCEDLEQNFNQIQVCGVALHKNLQVSRTRSEMDARKQLARRAAGQVDETIAETTDGSNSNVQTTAILTSKSDVGRYIIENQKTIQSEGKYLTFTKVVQYFN
ncbi:hypothetical protein HIMB100_00012240 [SAR116 cluster alpha proteobacterium HIMB100]|nr:hypothetical protein HIMB100_00012240 [SAR116 cluster alpha proteobacterium HIMB100]